MSIYSELQPIFEYFHQIRKLEDYIIYDIRFPSTWKVLKKFIIEDKFLNHGVDEDGHILLSFVSELTEESINLTQNNILGIVNFNLEREQKEKLLQDKIDELKNIFEKQTLDNLKSLKFDLKPNGEINFKRNGRTKTIEVAGEVQEE